MESQRLLQSLIATRQESRGEPDDRLGERKQNEKRCGSCARAVARIYDLGGEVETFCLKRSELFGKWVELETTFGDTSWLLSLTIAAEDVPNSVQQCSDRQKRLLAYRVIHDGIYGKYKNELRPRVALPACIIKQVRRLWPRDVTNDDLLAAGHRARSAPSPECEE